MEEYCRFTKQLSGGYLQKVRRVQEMLNFNSEQQAFDYLARRGLESVNTQLGQSAMLAGMTPEVMIEALRKQGLLEER